MSKPERHPTAKAALCFAALAALALLLAFGQAHSARARLPLRMPVTETETVVIGATLLTSAAGLGSKHAPEKAEANSSPLTARGPSAADRLEAEIITLTPRGFNPSEITRPQGRFVLGVENRTGLENIELVLERDGGVRVAALRQRKKRASWRDTVNPPPGRYVLSVANHPEWQCVITITPR